MKPANPMDPAFDPIPAYSGLDAPQGQEFRVTYSDGSVFTLDSEDEAGAIRQATNCYTGPAIVVSVTPTGRS